MSKLLPDNIPLADIDDYIALEGGPKLMDESLFERYMDPNTFRPVFVKEGKAYTMETAQDVQAIIIAYKTHNGIK